MTAMKRSQTKSDKHLDPLRRERPNLFRSKRAAPARVSVNHEDKRRGAGKRLRHDIRLPTVLETGRPPLKSPDGAEELAQIRAPIWDLLARCARLSRQIDVAFGGKVFLPGLDPLDPANQRRFWTCFHEHRRVTNLLMQALELWTASFGGQTGTM